MLGQWLLETNRMHEIDKAFVKERFVAVFENSPQALIGEPISHKALELLTDISIVIIATLWGILNLDKLFCNKWAYIMRSSDFGIILPKRGKVRATSSRAASPAHALPRLRTWTCCAGIGLAA